MASIIIHSTDNNDLSLLKALAEKMGLTSKVLSNEEKEDLVLGQAISENKKMDNLLMEEAATYYKSIPKK